jgi:aspartate aminotransferase-like enzyme
LKFPGGQINVNLRIPGPIPVPEDILDRMSDPMINHRGPEYKDLLYKVTNQLKQVFDTTSDVYIITGSGTAAMEAAIVNTLSPGDRLLNANVGVFGERFGIIAERYGAEVTTLQFPFGTAVDLDKLRDALKANPEIKVVSVTHNETSTGVTNNLQAVAEVVKGEFGKLLLVDGISSVCSLPLQTDAWGCDVVATASQKGWMAPPGMAFISFSEDAWKAQAESTMPKFYFDMAMYKRYYEIGQPPYTPAISIMFALDSSLDMILQEGMGSVFERHAGIGQFTRDSVKKLGLSVFPDESVASNTVTAVSIPEGVEASKLLAMMREQHNVVLAGGQQSLNGKIFRIGHMGRTSPEEIEDVMNALSDVLPKVGFKP